MELFLMVKCFKLLKEKGFNVKKLIMDDDIIIFIRVKKVIFLELMKFSDKNYVIKNFVSNLYKF